MLTNKRNGNFDPSPVSSFESFPPSFCQMMNTLKNSAIRIEPCLGSHVDKLNIILDLILHVH